MENQLIREQVFDVLFNYVKRADGIYTESDCATVRDEICLQIDQSKFTADEAEEHINQEVEKRIKERMPTVDDAENAQLTYEHNQTDCLDRFSYIHCYRDFMAGIEWLRSRLTCSEKPNNLKTEGGGE